MELVKQNRKELQIASPALHNEVLKHLSASEQKVVELKYSAKPFFSMDDDEADAFAIATMFKISVITGWQMPDNELHESELINQLKKIFDEKYSRVNIQEVEYAFRNHLQPDWGKFFNLGLLADVLDPYLAKRAEISALEERIKSKPKELPAPEITETDEERIQWARETYEATGNPLFISFELWPLIKTRVVLPENVKKELRKRAKIMVDKMAADDPFLFKDKSEDKWNNRVQAQLAMEYYFKQCKK